MAIRRLNSSTTVYETTVTPATGSSFPFADLSAEDWYRYFERAQIKVIADPTDAASVASIAFNVTGKTAVNTQNPLRSDEGPAILETRQEFEGFRCIPVIGSPKIVITISSSFY